VRRPDDLLVDADGRPHRRPAVGPPARRRSLSGSDPVAPTVFIGGGIDENVKRGVAERLDDASEAVVGTVSEGLHAGVHPENFVNWLARDPGGLQLEGNPAVRDREPGPVVATLAELVGERRI
jgi:phage replication-related protein YjqB (UPF0714/DUF867 family)